MARPGYVKKKEDRQYTAVEWLKEHPEDIPMARENLYARDHGYADDDVRQLYSAMCLQACVDYRRAVDGKKVDFNEPEFVIEECRAFFKGDIFQTMTNGMRVEEIEKILRSTQTGGIHHIWRKIEMSQQKQRL